MQKSRNQKRQRNIPKGKPQKPRMKEKILELALIKTYPNQVVWETWLPGTPIKVTTTVTTGAIGVINSVQANNVAAFATRFTSTFVEYRMIRAKWKVRLFSATNPGVLQIWIDEKSTAAPLLAEAQERAVQIISASSVDTRPMLKWISSDPLDLQYIATTTVNIPLATFKMFSNNTNFGASVVATDYCEIEPFYQFQFRGLQGV